MENALLAAQTWWRHASRRPLIYGLGMGVLALGVAALTVVAVLYRSVLSKPLPFPAPEELVTVPAPVWLSSSRADIPEEFAHIPAFAALGFYAQGEANVTRSGQPERIPAATVDAGFFRVFGVRPIRGRPFADSDDQRAPLAIVGERLWESLRDADGREPQFVTIGGRAFSIIAVMPGDFTFPANAALWVLPRASNEIAGAFFSPTVVGRLAPHSSIRDASVSLGLVTEVWSPGAGRRVTVQPLAVSAYGSAGRVLPLLLAMVVAAFVATCAAVCALWVSLVLRQRAELETRFALGASKGHLYRQIGLQLLVPSFAAIALGFALAKAALQSGIPGSSELPSTVSRELWFLATAIGFGILFSSGLATFGIVRSLLATVGTGMRVRFSGFRGFYTSLSMVQTIVAFLLVAATGVFLETVGSLLPVDLGLANPNAQVFRLSLPSQSYSNAGTLSQLIAGIEQDFQDTPGVTAVGVAATLPGDRAPVLLNGLGIQRPGSVLGALVTAECLPASGGFFRAAGIPIVAGRSFTRAEMLGTSSVAMLGLETVRQFGLSPPDSIGLQIRLGRPRQNEVVTVVGVVNDVRYFQAVRPAIYEPVVQEKPLPRQLAVVFDATAGSVDQQHARTIVEGQDRNLPIFEFRKLQDLSLITPGEKSVGWLLVCLAAISILQCLLAVFGISAQFIANEMRDVAVAMVLGLTPFGAVRRLMVTLVKPTAVGVIFGAGVALLAEAAAQSRIPQLAALHIRSLMETGAMLLLTALIASVPSARRAATVDVARTLRNY
ncbi:MAG TPA: ABC transporter permease [Vicinamibacterales bacterium]|nr:ABC transporter permease [Vicinamibacterales bacterium]